MYKGARYTGYDPILIGRTLERLQTGDVTTTIPEREAIGRKDFEPVYVDDSQFNDFRKEKKTKLKEKKDELSSE